MAAGTIAIAGSVAQKPHQGGHTWVFLQYLLGFRRLGWDVLFLDRLEPEMCTDEHGRLCPVQESVNLRYLSEVMRSFDLQDSFALFHDRGEQVFGLSRDRVRERVRASAFLLNVMGFFDDEEVLAAAPKRVFLDIDPGFGQMWCKLGLYDPFPGHEAFVTIGERIGQPDCTVPVCDIDWISTHQPVVLEYWQPAPPVPTGAFTSVGAWRGPLGPLEYEGKTYGLRAHEFRKFFALPRRSDEDFEIALDIHQAETADLEQLERNGWMLLDPRTIARDPWVYRDFIRGSKAEFLVAKNMYVESRSGWFSDRSICYLASGRPVLAQDTGLADLYPLGEGLLAYRTLEEAGAGVEAISAEYERHCRAARAIAEEYFDSDRVLQRLLERLEVR
jgi:hypothetical protein